MPAGSESPEAESGGPPSSDLEWEAIPAMPVILRSPSRRQKLNSPDAYDGTALVVRPVSMKEVATNPKAKAADDIEWDDLRKTADVG